MEKKIILAMNNFIFELNICSDINIIDIVRKWNNF